MNHNLTHPDDMPGGCIQGGSVYKVLDYNGHWQEFTFRYMATQLAQGVADQLRHPVTVWVRDGSGVGYSVWRVVEPTATTTAHTGGPHEVV